MNKLNSTVVEDNFLVLLKHLLSALNVKVTHPSVLKQIHRQLMPDREIIQATCRILNEWGVDAKSMPFNVEMLNEIPAPSLILLYKNPSDKSVAQFVILLDQDDNGAKLLDPKTGHSYASKAELQSKWTGVIIALDGDDAFDEKDYESKLSSQKEKINNAGGVSVIMPVYNQAAFITRALVSLQAQTYTEWEAILIDDGSMDDLQTIVSPFLEDERIRYFRNDKNEGLGYCLNKGIDNASYEMIAYLPADDLYYKNHLKTLVETLVATDAEMVFSGVLHHSNDQFDGNYGYESSGIIEDYPLQLVQVLHLKVKERWVERNELVTDDLHKMFWKVFSDWENKVVGTREITSEWVDHPYQRHKIINDRKGGGIYYYKQYYQVKEPIRFQSNVGNYIDEVQYFKPFRIKAKNERNGLKILLVGELAYNAERIMALEERGHKLYGIWINRPANYNTIGPLPFGNVEDITGENWKERILEIKPDIIYALLNYQAVPLAHRILVENLGIPFVWHFKEGPSHCFQNGTWALLVDLYSKSDGRIYTNATLQKWFEEVLPKSVSPSLVLDGELPKKDWFINSKSKLLSEVDNEIHTVFVGRPIGIFPEDIQELAEQKIHLHFYGDIFHVAYKDFLKEATEIAPDFIHTHRYCTQDDWVKEFSQYDAGWLHLFKSQNHGELLRANWLDLNNPARLSTYAMAGLPMLQRDNSGHIVATQTITKQLDIGVFFKDFRELGDILRDKERVNQIRSNVWNNRFLFSFDHNVDCLIDFFRKVISQSS